jgi:hypothetical protein
MTQTKDEALKLAIGKIKSARDCCFAEIDTLLFEAEEILEQVLAAPVQEPVEFGMHGEKMMFKVGVQQFTLDYEPDTQDEFNFMREMLIHAFSTFTPDVKTTPPAAPVPLTEPELRAVLEKTNHMITNTMCGPFWPELEQACRAIEAAHGITKGQK